MVSKRITVKKTRDGYLLKVFVRDRIVFHDLHVGVKRFFDKIKQQEKENESSCQEELKSI